MYTKLSRITLNFSLGGMGNLFSIFFLYHWSDCKPSANSISIRFHSMSPGGENFSDLVAVVNRRVIHSS